jgi:hypothetical protein
MRKIIVLFIVLLSLSFIINANDEYTSSGYDTLTDYYTGSIGLWNEDTSATNDDTKAINNIYFKTVSKTAILNDGSKYIVTYSSPNIVLYQWDGDSLAFVNSYQIETGTNYLDGDFIVSTLNNIPYIIYPIKATGSTTLTIHLLKYNGTFTHSQINISSLSTYTKFGSYKYSNTAFNEVYNGNPTLINCNSENDVCVAMYQYSATQYAFVSFDGLGYHAKYLRVFPTSGGADSLSMATTPTMIIEELNDGDLNLDVVVGVYNGWFDGASYIYKPQVVSLDLNSTKGLIFDWNKTVISLSGSTLGGWCRDVGVSEKYLCSRKVTGVMSMDFENVILGMKEIFIGAMSSAGHFRLYELSAIDGTIIDAHPDVFEIEGLFISNPIRLDCFEDTLNNDVGIMGYDTTANELVFMCSADPVFVGGNDDCEFNHYSKNLSGFDSYLFGKTIHPIEADGTKGDELITQFGIFDLDSPLFVVGVCSATEIYPIYNWSTPNLFVYPIDYQENNKADLLMTGDTLISYLDDGYANQNAQLDRVVFNPCNIEDGVSVMWMFNESVHITARAIDNESNDVRFRAILYYNSPYAIDSGWSNYTASGSEYDILMNPNRNIGIATVRVYTQDSLHTSTDYYDAYFGVSSLNTSKSFGDCVNIVDISTIAPVIPDVLQNNTVNVNDNVITNAIRDLGGFSGLSITVIYIIFMIIIAMVLLFSDIATGQKFYLILFIEVLLVIIGVKIAIFGTGTMIVMTILLLLGGISAVFKAIGGSGGQ